MKKFLITVSATLDVNEERLDNKEDFNVQEAFKNEVVSLADCIITIVDIDTAEEVCKGLDIIKEVKNALKKA